MGRKLIFYFMMIFITAIVCFAMLELGVRAFFEGPKYLCTMNVKDKDLGFRLKPNATMIIDFSYFKQNISLNSMGLRDVDYGRKEADEKRILALGDSFVFGAVEHLNQTFVKVFESRLNKKNSYENSSAKYRVINAGVSGYGSFEEKEFLKLDGLGFEPDKIIYFFYLNDVESDLDAPQSTVLDNGCIVSKYSIKEKRLSFERISNWLVLNSRAYVFFRFILLNEKQWFRNSLYKIRNVMVDLGLADQGMLQYKALLSEYDKKISDGWNATINNIKEMKEFADGNKLKFAVVMIPMKFQIYDDLWIDYKIRNRINDSMYDFKKPARILKESADANSIDFIDLTDIIKTSIKNSNLSERIYYEGDAHFNELGNEIVGEILYEKFGKV